MSITVIDAPPGTGKTQWAIQEINEHPERNYVICTPFLTEISRFQRQCRNRNVATPNNFDSTKIEDFNNKLDEGRTTAVTHVTFLNATEATKDCIRRNEYHLILDEALDLVVEFNKTGMVQNDIKQALSKKDIELLFDGKFIEVDKTTKQVKWTKRYYDGKFSAVERMAKSGRLFFIRDELFVCVFPPEIFRVFKSVTILTYMIGGSYLKAYFEKNNLEYILSSVREISDSYYELCEYDQTADTAFKEKLRNLVSVVSDPKMNFNFQLSKKWYQDRRTKEITEQMKRNVTKFVRQIAKASASKDEVMWTCPKEYMKDLEGDRYTYTTKITPQDEEHRVFLEELRQEIGEEDFKEQQICFVPCNSRGTNRYRYRWALAYLCDLSYNTMINGYFLDDSEWRRENGLDEIKLDDKQFALSCFIQWMFRSRIRDDKPVIVYIPSKRIRELFLNWLYEGNLPDEFKPVKSKLRTCRGHNV